VRPHVRGERSGQRVQGQLLEPVAQRRVPRDREGGLERVHQLDDGAELRSLRRVAPGQVLVAREHAARLAVVAVEHLERQPRRIAVARIARVAPPERRRLDAHGVVHPVRGVVDVAEAPAQLLAPALQRVAPDAVGVAELLEVRAPVPALLARQARQVEEPVVSRALVEPVEGDQQLRPARPSPAVERPFAEQPGEARGVAPHRGHAARIAPPLGVLREGLQDDQLRPRVALASRAFARGVADRAEPAVRVLVLEDVVDPAVRARPQLAVVQGGGERDHAIEPVGPALPALGIAPDPRAVAHVRPDLVQVPREAVRLHAQLSRQPAARPDATERKRLEDGRRQRGCVPCFLDLQRDLPGWTS
jgi:hypothetical protein